MSILVAPYQGLVLFIYLFILIIILWFQNLEDFFHFYHETFEFTLYNEKFQFFCNFFLKPQCENWAKKKKLLLLFTLR